MRVLHRQLGGSHVPSAVLRCEWIFARKPPEYRGRIVRLGFDTGPSSGSISSQWVVFMPKIYAERS